eukprot:172774-Prorocentrum_minimum.AAC.1
MCIARARCLWKSLGGGGSRAAPNLAQAQGGYRHGVDTIASFWSVPGWILSRSEYYCFVLVLRVIHGACGSPWAGAAPHRRLMHRVDTVTGWILSQGGHYCFVSVSSWEEFAASKVQAKERPQLERLEPEAEGAVEAPRGPLIHLQGAAHELLKIAVETLLVIRVAVVAAQFALFAHVAHVHFAVADATAVVHRSCA